MRKVQRAAILFAALLALSGCRVEVYDKLSQRDANEMTALLLMAGIDAERTSHKDGTFAVAVDESDFAQAVTLIDRSGLPKPKFATMNEVFNDDRLIASPSEERARLNYALSQELSQTVSGIDGVVSARVHLATPSADPLARRESQSTASVAIHHRADLETAGVVPRIKVLVANAVDGLEYDRVSIALFPTSDASSPWPDEKSSRRNQTAVEFLDPTPKAPAITAPPARTQSAVTPAAFGGFEMSPAIAAILGGGFVILLLVGHALLTGTWRKKTVPADDNTPRHRVRR